MTRRAPGRRARARVKYRWQLTPRVPMMIRCGTVAEPAESLPEFTMRRTWPLVTSLLLLAAGGGFAWWRSGPLAVEVIAPRRGAAVEAIYATGTVEPTVMLPIAPRVAGRIVTLASDEGRSVRKGEELARLESQDLDSTVAELAARSRYAHAEFERMQALVKRGVAAATDLDRTRADAEAADASLDRARAQRNFMVLTAPAAGTVIRRDGEIGQFIPVGQPIFYLSCCAPLRVSADVDEEDIPRVQVGMKVVLHADALPNRTFDGEVGEITPKGDPVARTYRVRIRLADPTAFSVGMTVDANLIVAVREHALLLPTVALAKGAVWLVRDGRLVRQPVQAGVTSAAQTEIRSGLSDDAQVVATLTDALREGRRARAAPAAPPAPAAAGAPGG
jgi:RND family efflux transporter MFP subunit